MRTRFEDIALWAFGDFALGQDFDLISDMTRARRFGFHDVVDSEAMLLRILRHALTSLEREPGCQRFDVHQERSDPTLFFLIEAYSGRAHLVVLDAARPRPGCLGASSGDWRGAAMLALRERALRVKVDFQASPTDDTVISTGHGLRLPDPAAGACPARQP